MSGVIRVDLHTHSCLSDGTMSPSGIIAGAANLGLAAVALTDHDTVSGLDEFMAAASAAGVEAVPGVEVSCSASNREIHIVGLFIDWKHSRLTEFLEGIREQRNHRNSRILAKLNSLGYAISLEELLERAGGESIGRPHFAAILIEKGYFKDNQDAFERCLKRGRPGFCRRELPTPAEAIQHIHAAGGLAIWAHPVYRNKYARSHVRGMLNKLTVAGLDGMEAMYPGFTPEQQSMLMELVAHYHLLPSGGSDFHGENIPQIKLGGGDGSLEVPVKFYTDMKQAWRERAAESAAAPAAVEEGL